MRSFLRTIRSRSSSQSRVPIGKQALHALLHNLQEHMQRQNKTSCCKAQQDDEGGYFCTSTKYAFSRNSVSKGSSLKSVPCASRERHGIFHRPGPDGTQEPKAYTGKNAF